MRSFLRSVLALVLGAVVAFVCAMGLEYLGHTIYPPPAEFQALKRPADLEQMTRADLQTLMDKITPPQLLLVLAAWVGATFAGAAVAARIAPGAPIAHAFVIGGLLLFAAVSTMLMIPHPVWFWAVSVPVFFPVAYLAARCAAGNRPRPLAAEGN